MDAPKLEAGPVALPALPRRPEYDFSISARTGAVSPHDKYHMKSSGSRNQQSIAPKDYAAVSNKLIELFLSARTLRAFNINAGFTQVKNYLDASENLFFARIASRAPGANVADWTFARTRISPDIPTNRIGT